MPIDGAQAFALPPWVAFGQVLEETDDSSEPTPDRFFVYGNYVDEPCVMYRDEDSSFVPYYYLSNSLYSVAVLVDDTGAVKDWNRYDVYGKTTVHIDDGNDTTWFTDDDGIAAASSKGNPYGFTGRRYETYDSGNLALYYYRNRYYSPGLGRFLQRDPGAGAGPPGRLGTAGSPGRGAFAQRGPARNQYADGMNLYHYVRSNPVNLVDPSGLYSKVGNCPDFREKCACVFATECPWGACRRASALSTAALAQATSRYPGTVHNGKGDAWRHCYWSCTMTQSLGKACAKKLGDNHEDCGDRYGQPLNERSMDEHNNHVGRERAARQGDCADLCEKALTDGDLTVLAP